METRVLSVYVDGGVIRINPSPIGGTWAYVHVSGESGIVRKGYGVMAPDTGIDGYVTNNVSELYALCMGILAVPGGSADVHIYSDSQVSLRRVFKDATMKGVPPWLIDLRKETSAHLKRIQRYRWTLLDGHPTRAQLASGVGKRGGIVSAWNVWCDTACCNEAKKHLEKLNQAVAA